MDFGSALQREAVSTVDDINIESKKLFHADYQILGTSPKKVGETVFANSII